MWAGITRELCEHLSHLELASGGASGGGSGDLSGVKPAAVIACAPQLDRNRLPFDLTEQEVGG